MDGRDMKRTDMKDGAMETGMAGTDMEREVKLAAKADFVLPDLTGVLPGAVVSVEPPRWMYATYWDTADLRLARAGITVRHRAGDHGPDRWTAKLPGRGQPVGGLMTRREIDVAGGPEAVPEPVARLVRGQVRTAGLVPVARLTTRRVSLELRDRSGCRVAQVDDDEVTVDQPVAGGDGRPTRFREVEVELAPEASDSAADAVVERLIGAGATEADPVPKALRALGPPALAGPEAQTVRLDAKAGAGALVRAAVGAGTSRLLRHDPGVRLGDDPEEVHQARVATRRLRSDLATLAALADSSWVEHLRSELAWLGDALGAVRDADVLLDQLRADARLLPACDYEPAAHLLEALGGDREGARAVLAGVLDSPRYLSLLDALVDAANAPRLGPPADAPAAELAPELVGAAWKRLVRAIDDLGEASGDEALHQVRIKAKRCRYAAEAVAPVTGKRAARLARRVADLQGVLGDLHDAVVAEARLRQTVTSPDAPLTPEQAMVAGALMEVARRRAGVQRRQWEKVWRKASKAKVHSWLR